MIAWMLYTLVVTAVIAAAARAAETLARVVGCRLRWVWGGALLLSAVLSASSALRLARGAPSASFAIGSVGELARVGPDPSPIERAQLALGILGRSLDAPMRSGARALDGAIAPTHALLAWLVISLGLTALFVAVARRAARLRATWPSHRLCDVDVRVSPTIGPVALGIIRPEIVVPRWLLERCVEEQGLAVAHEREHLRARDPLLIALGWSVVIAAPWNAALWYMVSRLRLAIEVDCDARVLRRGASARAYGTLLIDVASSASPLGLGALALVNASHLHERIVMLRPESTPFRRLRAAAALPCAMLGLLVACQATVPASRPAARVETVNRPSVAPDSAPASPATTAKAEAPAPTIYIDGARSSWDALHALPRTRIKSVEVLKGAAALAVYGNDAENGVILVTTKDDLKQ